LLLFVAAEFGLRCFSYHRAMQYEQQEDLSFTPVPDQQYVEKISLTRSQTNHFGLRGKNVDLAGGKRTILCLGDSVTYGYGLDDEHTYPAQLQKHLDRQYPGHFLVLNAGVDAYPITLMREKFLSLWKQGVHPEVVIVGYSFNEGGVGHLIETDPEVRSRFSHALHLKNHLRGLALYNVLVENWGRSSYDRYKRYMISGADSGAVSPADLQHWYQHSLRELTDDLRARQVTPVFLLFAGLNGRTKQYDTRAPFQAHFQEFTEQNHLPLLLSSAAFGDTQPISGFFLDQCHMSAKGTHAVGEALGEYLSHTMQR